MAIQGVNGKLVFPFFLVLYRESWKEQNVLIYVPQNTHGKVR